MSRRRVLAGLALAGLSGSDLASAAADDAAPLRFAFTSFPPFTFVGPNGPDGTMLRLVERMMARLDRRWSAEELPAQRLRMMLAQGRADFAFGVPAPEFESAILLGNQAVARIDLVAYSLGSAMAASSAAEMAGKRVILRRTYGYGGLRQVLEAPGSGAVIVDAEDLRQGLRLLRLGRGDLLVEYAHLVRGFGDAVSVDDLLATRIQRIEIFIIVSRRVPDAEALLAQLEGAFVGLKGSSGIADLQLGV